MNSEQVTLNDFFSTAQELRKDRFAKIESSEKDSRLKEALEEARLHWPALVEEVIPKVADLLNVTIPDIVKSAWKKYTEIQKYTDKERYPPGKSYRVKLFDQTVESEHHPFIEILINDQPVGRVDFEIMLSLTFESVILTIQDAKIKTLETGTCIGAGTVKCENHIILERKTEPIPLPGSFSLGQGIPIG